MMSVLEIYINWVNSVLGESGSYVEGVEAVQDGKVLCELIDVLAPDAGLVNKVKSSGDCTPMAYINMALEHMKSHGIKIKFPAQDILHNEIKSMLDVLWLLILNYGIHYIGQNAAQRSVGTGKKKLLEWCQEELGAAFDARNTLSFNLCNGKWFVRLLEKMAGCSMKKSEDKAEYIDTLLTEIQDRYLIKKDIIKAHDIVDGTADEHTLMIYLSLLKRRMSYSDRPSRREMLSTDGKAAAMAKIHFFERRARSLSNESTSPRSASPIHRGRSLSSGGRSSSAHSDDKGGTTRTRSRSLLEQTIVDGNETSDWSSTGSLISGRENKPSPHRTSPSPPPSTLPLAAKNESNSNSSRSDTILQQTISDRVVEQFPVTSESDRDDKEAESQRISEKETDTLSDFSSSSLAVRDKPPPVQIIVQSHTDDDVSSAVNNERSDSRRRVVRNGRDNAEQPSSAYSNGVSSRTRSEIGNIQTSSYPNSSSLTNGVGTRTQNGSDTMVKSSVDATHSSLNRRTRNGVSSLEHTSPSINGVGRDGYGSPVSISSERSSDSREIRRLGGNAKEEETRIKIKRPKDYILQWEDTMGRLSGTAPSNEPSPRPLISNYRIDLPSRSKSSELKTPTIRNYDPNNLRSRSTDLTNRSIERYQPSSLSTINAYNSSIRHTSNLRGSSSINASSDTGLESVLSQLPEDMRQKAADASKFLMQTSGPEVLNLIDAIKKAREGVQISMPAAEDARPPQAATSGGSRVRFQTSSRSPSQREAERGEASMLSISPRSRSRSLSPRQTSNSRPHSDNETYARSTELKEVSEGNRSRREEVLLKSLGMNNRVVEDERPSSRIMAMTSSSPTHGGSQSPGRVHKPSPRKVPEKKYPEVTRLDLGLDSDRSYTSQMDENVVDDATPRRGGSGRIPRREAWELQKRRKDHQNNAPFNHEDPAAQSKFIEVLCKEIDSLKVKVEMMEDEGIGRSHSQQNQHQHNHHYINQHHHHHRSPSALSNSRMSDSSYLTRDLHEEDNELFLDTRSIQQQQQQQPCKFTRNNSCPLLEVSSRTNLLSKTPSAQHSASTVLKQPVASRRENQNRRSYSSTSASRSPAISAPQSPRRQNPGSISLGYSGPTRSITPEIWGNDPTTPEGLDPRRQEKWKRLISRRDLSEGDVIELKQALACAIVEHDILYARLNNAKHEIHDKLRHTNEVLDDCRHHLAKSQAENMELRSKTEQERQRGDDIESKLKDMEKTVHEVHKDNKQLEKELDQTASLLDKSLVDHKPGIDVLQAEKARLVSRLANAETDNERLKNEVDKLKRNQFKTLQTMDELRECLSKVRRERQEIFEEFDSLHRREQTARVRQIINNYQKKGLIHDLECDDISPRHQQASHRGFEPLDSDEGVYSGSQTSAAAEPSFLSNFKSDANCSRLLDNSFSSSPGNTPRGSASQHHNTYFSDDLSPEDREIYPHRKSYQPRSRSCSPLSTNRTSSMYADDSYFNTSYVDNSLIDQTLQDIEKDMQRERETLLFRVNERHRLRFIPYLESSDNHHHGQSTTHSSSSPSSHNNSRSLSSSRTTQDVPNRGFSSDRSPYRSTSNSSSRSHRQQIVDNNPRHHHNNSARTDSSNRGAKPTAAAANRLPPDNLPSKRSTSLGSVGAASPRQSMFRTGGRHVVSRSPSPSMNRTATRDDNRSGYITPERSPSPVYFPRASHSPPTRLSPENRSSKSKSPDSRRPRHERSRPGEIARNLQKEFEKEDKMIASMSKSSVFKNKSWIEVQSDSDGDTGINSSISSYGSDRSGIGNRKSAPFLTDEQRRYADELIQKYTRNPPG